MSHHDSIDHVSDSSKFITLSIARSHCLGLLSLLLTLKSILKILLFILEILSHSCKLDHLLLVTRLLPLEKGLGETLLMEVDES